jgi:hypothetical protein
MPRELLSTTTVYWVTLQLVADAAEWTKSRATSAKISHTAVELRILELGASLSDSIDLLLECTLFCGPDDHTNFLMYLDNIVEYLKEALVHESTITVTDGQTGHSFVYQMRFGGKCLDLKGTKTASGQSDGWRHINPWNHASKSAYECGNLVSYRILGSICSISEFTLFCGHTPMFWSSVTRRKPVLLCL